MIGKFVNLFDVPFKIQARILRGAGVITMRVRTIVGMWRTNVTRLWWNKPIIYTRIGTQALLNLRVPVRIVLNRNNLAP